MEKTRVPYGEKYWYISPFGITSQTDEREGFANHDYKIGNYFSSETEAETMVRKLRAVLKGADVIEMPSEEDIHWASRVGFSNDFSYDFKRGVEWLKSKIVK